MTFPDGHLIDDLIVFPHVASRGYELSLPDLREARPEVLNELSDLWHSVLLQIPEGLRMSFQSERRSDFHRVLNRFARDTLAGGNAWSRLVREERHTRYTARMRAGQLVRQRTVLFLSVRLENMPDTFSSPFHLEERYRAVLHEAKCQLQQAADKLTAALAGHGGHLDALKDAGHHRHFARFLNPSLSGRPDFDPVMTFDPDRSIHANCWWSEATGDAHGFFMDGHYHALRVFTRWPAQLSATSLQSLWELPGPNHRVTVNIRSRAVKEVIKREEIGLRRLQGQLAAEGRPSLIPKIEKKRKRIEQLASMLLRPFAVEIIVHTWAPTREALASQCAAVEQAIQGSGAQYFAPTLPTTNKRLLAQTWPGYPWGSYTHYQLHASSDYLPGLLPLGTSFTGHLNEAEALFESPRGSLVGMRTTSGGQPLHMVICGGTGAGKSMLLGEIITQIAPFFGSIVFLDFGGSHETVARALDPKCRSVVLHPNSPDTFNYVGTGGTPLTNEHLSDVAALGSIMCGTTATEREDRLRRVAISVAVTQLYTSRFNHLERQQPERALEIARLALAVRQHGGAQADPLEAFIDFRDWRTLHPDEAQAKLAAYSEGDAVTFLKDPTTRREAVRMSAARLAPGEEPTHDELQEWLHLRATATHDPVLLDLAELMKSFGRGGCAGQLFSGVSTVSLDQPVMHIELGRLDSGNPTLLAAGGHLAHLVAMRRNLILPRHVRKFVLFEEASALLSLPGAESLMRRGYEQSRKYNAVLAAVFQNYSRLRALALCPTLLGNTQQFILLKQDGLPDLKQLVEDLGLPTSMMNTMSQFPRPANAGYADFTLFSRDTPHPVCGVARHVPSKEMFYASNTTPALSDARRSTLRGEGDLISRIQQATT